MYNSFDSTERMQAEQLEAGQKRVLELIVEDAPVPAVFDALVRMIEQQSPTGMRASILVLHEDGKHLQHGAAPSLPDAYNRAIDGIAIGPGVGSCGTAAYLKEAVFVSDIANDPLWRDFTELAAEHGLRACWSTPIFSSTGRLLGTFAMYYPEVREPNEDDLSLVRIVTGTAAIAIERAGGQQALRASEAQLRTLFDQAPLGIYLIDADFRIRQVNPTALPVFGDIPDLIGRDFDQVLHILWTQEYADEVVRLFRHTLQTGESYRTPELAEHRLDRGVTEYYEWQIDRIPLPEARYGVVCYFREISAQVHARARIAESEARYRTLFESIDEGFCIIEMIFDDAGQPVDYRFLETNAIFEQQTGLTNAAGRTARELVPGLEHKWIEVYGRIALTGESARFADYAEPMRRWFDVYASRVGDAASNLVALVFRDITERKQAEEISRRAAELDAFRVSLADALRPLADPVGIQATASRLLGEHLGANRVAYFEVRGDDYFVDRDYVNDAVPLAGGYPIASFGPQLLAAYRTGRAVFASDVSADSSLSQAERSAYAALQIGAYIGLPLIKGGEFVAGLAVNTTRPRAWTPDEVTLTAETAERTWAAVERARAEEKLRESDRRKDEFLATLAHELRNPLAPLLSGLTLAQLAGDADQRQSALALMQRQLAQMVRLVDELLDVGRVSSGKIELKREPVALASVLQQAIETSRPLIEQAAHRLVVDVGAKPPYVMGDPVRLAQVFANLLNNAAKYTDPGGSIELAVRRVDHRVRVVVKDSGVGIEPAMLPKIFEMFAQVDRSVARSQGGLGVGLSLVKRLVELHGGSIEVKSGSGAGSEFTVDLPLFDAHRAHDGPVQTLEVASPLRRRILVVDDNRDAALSLAALLEFSGHETQVAHDGVQALAKVPEFGPDVVLLDLGMPKMNGYEAARAIRAQPGGGNVKLIALTGWGQGEDRRRTAEAGFDAHLVKPAEPAQLEKVVQSLFAQTA